MALVVPAPNDKKRVKVYELRNNDWFDRGTGFCSGRVINVRDAIDHHSGWLWIAFHGSAVHNGLDCGKTETDRPCRMSPRYTSSPKISRSGCCWRPRSPKMTVIKNNKVTGNSLGKILACANRLAETLIVWTESNGTDMALSFQEAEGCAAIW